MGVRSARRQTSGASVTRPSGGPVSGSVKEPETTSRSGSVSAERLLSAALAAFVEKGFHGTSMRDIARRAGTSVSHTYYYFPTKQDLLWRIVGDITDRLAIALEETARQARRQDMSPAEELAAVVGTNIMFHTHQQDASFVGNSELRSLREEDLVRVVAIRDRIASVFMAAIQRGIDSGDFDCPSPKETKIALVTMGTSVAVWFRDNGPETPETIAERFADIALRLVGYRGEIDKSRALPVIRPRSAPDPFAEDGDETD